MVVHGPHRSLHCAGHPQRDEGKWNEQCQFHEDGSEERNDAAENRPDRQVITGRALDDVRCFYMVPICRNAQ